MASTDERNIRIQKLNKLREEGINPYLDRCDRTCMIGQARQTAKDDDEFQLCGRLMLKRSFGKLIFATLQDFSERIQIDLNRKNIDEKDFKFFEKMIDVGDFIYVHGTIHHTEKGELTLGVRDFKLLSKAIRPLPEKFHGLTDLEARSRQRYLDLIMNKETRERFIKRTKFVNALRDFLNKHDFMEVETPILQVKPSGALAKPFKTHHNALDIDMYLRIAPETYLKRLIAGGFDRVYDLGRCFRNEGIDPSHLQEFTMIEYYAAYWNYIDNMNFTEKLLKHLLMEVNGSLKLNYQGTEIDFDGEWPRYSFRELIIKHADIDIDEYPTKDELVKAIKAKNITLEGVDYNKIGRGNLIDQLYKKVARPQMINPQFLIHHPIDLSPLARRNDENPLITDRFQLVVNGWEVVNAYSELIDPIDQKARLEEQARAREKGDEEAMIKEDDFIACMEYGMPPISGWGMGIDRFVALLTNQENLREVVLFPTMKLTESTDSDKSESETTQENVPTDSTVYKPTDIADIGVENAKLDEFFASHINNEGLVAHSRATSAVTVALAKKFGFNENSYKYLGLLVDADLPDVGGNGSTQLQQLGADATFCHAISAYTNAVKPTCFVDYALVCSANMARFIMAVAKVYPDKKVASVKVKSITKRLKEKSFAANIDRDTISCCANIGLSVEEFSQLALDALCSVSNQIGL